MISNELRILKALRQRRRVTRKTAIENGWAENLTATISRLRTFGFVIEALRAKTPEGEMYTRYHLVSSPKNSPLMAKVA
jgi:hypothetical protein